MENTIKPDRKYYTKCTWIHLTISATILIIAAIAICTGYGPGTSTLDQIVENELMILGLERKLAEESHKRLNQTGFAQYRDSAHLLGTELALADGDTITLPNDASFIMGTQLPKDVDSFYNRTDTLIIGRSGDGLAVMVDFLVKPTSAMDTRITVGVDIGAASGQIFGRDFVLSKGQDVAHHFLNTTVGFTGAIFEANGGKIRITTSGGPVEIWNIGYVLTRTHKAR